MTDRMAGTRSTRSGPGSFDWLRPRQDSSSSYPAVSFFQVNQSARMDIQLTVGQLSETVEVSAEAAMLGTETSSRGAVIDQTKIVELPLNGRDYNQLALLSPRSTRPDAASAVGGLKGRIQCQRQSGV